MFNIPRRAKVVLAGCILSAAAAFTTLHEVTFSSNELTPKGQTALFEQAKKEALVVQERTLNNIKREIEAARNPAWRDPVPTSTDYQLLLNDYRDLANEHSITPFGSMNYYHLQTYGWDCIDYFFQIVTFAGRLQHSIDMNSASVTEAQVRKFDDSQSSLIPEESCYIAQTGINNLNLRIKYLTNSSSAFSDPKLVPFEKKLLKGFVPGLNQIVESLRQSETDLQKLHPLLIKKKLQAKTQVESLIESITKLSHDIQAL